MIRTLEELTPCGTMRALLTEPDGFDPARESLPLILFLHGAGERGDDLGLLNRHGIPRFFSQDASYHGLRVLTLSPQCPKGAVWNHLLPSVHALLTRVIAERHVDPAAVTVTGISMGGFGTWDLIQTYPELFAAAAPICGGGMTWRNDAIGKLPVRAFHGTADDAVPFWNSVNMVNDLRSRGGCVTLTPELGYHHDCWTHVYADTDLIDWLAAARR